MIKIIQMSAADWEDVRRIYLQGIATGMATFETTCPEWDKWDADHRTDCRLVAIKDSQVVGWAALSYMSGRCAYSGVAEISIYVDEQHRGQHVGDDLLAKLIKRSEEHNIWTLQAGIFPENTASIGLHRKHGFRIVGTREKIGKLHGQWRDIVLMERRSNITGIK